MLALGIAIIWTCSCSGVSLPLADILEMIFKPAKVTKGPYLLRVYQDRAAIMWETDFQGTCRLYYGEPGKTKSYIKSLGQQVSYDFDEGKGTKVTFVHKVWLDDLEPGLTYSYHIEGGGLCSKTYQFRTPLGGLAEANEVKFVVYGDSRTNAKTHRKLIEIIIKKRPDFVVNVGDLVTDGNDYSQWSAQFFEPLKGLAESVPVYTAKGNHDGSKGNYEMLLIPDGEESNFSFDWGPIHYFCADNVSGNVNEQALLELISTDAQASRAAWKFVSYNVPSVNFGGHWSDWAQREALPALAGAGVDFVISGHSYQYERFWPIEPLAGNNGSYVTYITSGGGGAPLYDITPYMYHACAKSVHHFCFFHIKGNTLTMDAIDVDDRVIDHLEITKDDGRLNKSYLWTAVPMNAVMLHQRLHDSAASPMGATPNKGQPFTVAYKTKIEGVGESINMIFQLRSEKGVYEPADTKTISVPTEGGVVEVELTATPLVDVTLAKDKVDGETPIMPPLWIDCHYKLGRVRETMTWPVTQK
jgi:predicted phosphodiesterase